MKTKKNDWKAALYAKIKPTLDKITAAIARGEAYIDGSFSGKQFVKSYNWETGTLVTVKGEHFVVGNDQIKGI